MSEPSHDAMRKTVVGGDVDQARPLAKGAVHADNTQRAVDAARKLAT